MNSGENGYKTFFLMLREIVLEWKSCEVLQLLDITDNILRNLHQSSNSAR